MTLFHLSLKRKQLYNIYTYSKLAMFKLEYIFQPILSLELSEKQIYLSIFWINILNQYLSIFWSQAQESARTILIFKDNKVLIRPFCLAISAA